MIIGKRQNLSRVALICILLLAFSINVKSKGRYDSLEQKAVIYFCENIEKLNNYNISFGGMTAGVGGNIFDIAHCVGDIHVIKDSISNREELNNIQKQIDSTCFEKKEINIEKYNFFKRRIFFNKYAFRLKVYNAIRYKGKFYVELFLLNKDMQVWIVCVEFDNSGVPISHCTNLFDW